MMYLIIPTEDLKEIYAFTDTCRKSQDGTRCIIHKGTVDRIMNYASVLPSNGEDEPANPYPYPLVAGDEINLMPEFQSKEANESSIALQTVKK